jgi:hypothetical protein
MSSLRNWIGLLRYLPIAQFTQELAFAFLFTPNR